MFFRFGSAVVLVVSISLTGIALEKQNLELRRRVSRQHYQLDALLEQHARLRLQTQELGAPVRVIQSLENGDLEQTGPEPASRGVAPPNARAISSPGMPLLRWREQELPRYQSLSSSSETARSRAGAAARWNSRQPSVDGPPPTDSRLR